MLQVTLVDDKFSVKFTHTNDFGQKREYDSIAIQETSQSRVYCTAIKNGMKYTTIAKKMQFDDDGNVYLKFGKNKVIIGTYEEVAA